MKNALVTALKGFAGGILGLMLATAGLILIWHHEGPKSVKVSAADVPYTVEWQATKLLTAQISDTNFRDPKTLVNDSVAIGVAEWSNKIFNGSGNSKTLVGQETWTIPDPNASYHSEFNADGTVKFVPTNNSAFDPSKWLLGMAGATILDFSAKNVGNVQAVIRGRAKADKFAGGNGGITCAGDDRDCYFSTGAYGFVKDQAIGQGGQGGSQVVAGGIFMPLQWTVTGTLFNQ